MQPQPTSSQTSPELAHLLNLQADLSARITKMAELDGHIAQAQAEIERLSADQPDLAAMNAQRQLTASCVAIGSATEGELLQLEQDIAKAEFKASGIAQEVQVQQDLIAGFKQQRAQCAGAMPALRVDCSRALTALLMAQASQFGAAYVQAAAQLEVAYGRMMALSEIIRDMTGHAAFRCMGALEVPSFTLPVVEQARKPYPPYALFNIANVRVNLRAGWIADTKSELRSIGVQID